MPNGTEWAVATPRTIDFDGPVAALKVRVVGGTVNVVGTADPAARLEVSAIEGPPLLVSHQGDQITIAYEDLGWKGFLTWREPTGWRRRATVTLAVPAATRVEVGVVFAAAMVSGITSRTDVKGVSGDTTLVGISGEVRAETVSGSMQAQALSGDLRFNSVSGRLTIIDGAGAVVRADTVSGDMVVDLAPAARGADVRLGSVSGEIAVRLPEPADTEIEASTTTGAVSNAFAELDTAPWGVKRVSGRLGQGKGRLKASTVSGALALLRRPPGEDELADDTPGDTPGPTDKKVL